MEDKPLAWLGTSLSDIRKFSDPVRRNAGFELRRVQMGLDPTDWKHMSSVGRGVMEIRLRGQLEHRVLYIAKFSEAIYVLHAFQKKSQKTRKTDIETARKRLSDLKEMRSPKKEA